MKKISLLVTAFGILSISVNGQTRDNAGLQGNAGAVSGFFETYSPVNYPAGANSWWHLLDVRHSNTVNNYAMQFSGSFFDQEIYFRKTDNNPARSWQRIVGNDVSTPLGTTAKYAVLLSSVRGNIGANGLAQNLWTVRQTGGNDWTTARLHDGISIDGSYVSPQTNTKTWWERDAYSDVQSWAMRPIPI